MDYKSSLLFVLLFFFLLNHIQCNALILPKSKATHIEDVLAIQDTVGYNLKEVEELFLRKSFGSNKNYSVINAREKNVYWIYFKVSNDSNFDNEWIIEFPGWSFIDCYIRNKYHSTVQRSGHLLPFKERDYSIANKNLILLKIKGKSSQEYFVRLESNSISVLAPSTLGFSISPKSLFLKYEGNNKLILGLIIGILIVMLFYNVFIFFMMRDRNYIYYIILLFACIWNVDHNSGYWHERLSFFENYSLLFNYFDILLCSFIGIFYLYLIKSLIKTKVNLPFWDNVIVLFIGIFLQFPALLIGFSPNFVFRMQTVFVIFATSVLIFLSGVSLRKKIPSSSYFLLANIFMFLCTKVFMLKELNVIEENLLTEHSLNIGIVVQAALFSLAFADRVNILRQENDFKQLEIIRHLEEHKIVLSSWKEALINTEKLQKESESFQYEALKNQINPHFLFNSLNVLIGLLYKNQEDAEKFVKELAQIYRYVLKNKDKELVDISEELEFVDAFVYLLRIRFNNSLIVLNALKKEEALLIPPLALQILIENAIKHNQFSDENPLQIKLYMENDFIIVSNTIQLKEKPEEISGIGLNNLRSRYEYLTEKEIEVVSDANTFIVKLPKLKY